jgi:hypothetical protein
MESPDLTITPGGRRFVLLWGVAVALLFIGLGVFSVTTVNQLRLDAIARHNARIDPHAVEPGRTAADDTLPAGANPRKVTVGMYVDNISSISILESNWAPVFYIWFRWTGDDINPGETFNIVEGEIVSKTKLNDETINGEHYTRYLVKAQISKFFNTSRFPVDDHLLTIAIEDGKAPWRDLEYVADTGSSNISSRVKMPGYVIHKTGMVVKPHTYKTTFGDPRLPPDSRETYSQLIYGIWNARPGLGTYFKVFVGLFAAILIALLAFFIKPTDVDPRFGLGVGGFFGAVANTLLSASLVTDGGTLTLLDMVNGIGMITIFLTLLQSTISLYLYDIRGKVGLSHLYDRVSLIIFGIGLLTINVLIPIVGLTR